MGAAHELLLSELATHCPLSSKFETVSRVDSSRQPDPSATAPRFDDRASGACRHPVAKTVPSRPLAGVGLERPLHLSLVSSFRCRASVVSPDAAMVQWSRCSQPARIISASGARKHRSTRRQGPARVIQRTIQLRTKRQPGGKHCTGAVRFRAHPASSPRRPHLWMLVWRTS